MTSFPCLVKNLPSLFKTAYSLEAFLQISVAWSSNFTMKSMLMPNRVTLFFASDVRVANPE